jgi:bifunctional DNA-binding transcriptional regulator/antitoxin component of YhaV-PrlF toxin-antitoxin module
MKNETTYEVIVQEDESGDLILPLPLPVLQTLGWKEGDDLIIDLDDNGKIYLRKA